MLIVVTGFEFACADVLKHEKLSIVMPVKEFYVVIDHQQKKVLFHVLLKKSFNVNTK